MNQQAAENRQWLRNRMDERGLTAKLMPRAAAIAATITPSAAPWFENYARAYSDGHNNRGLHGRRLDHYANAFADICEEVSAAAPELEMTLDAFWLLWDAGDTFEGACTEHWYFT